MVLSYFLEYQIVAYILYLYCGFSFLLSSLLLLSVLCFSYFISDIVESKKKWYSWLIVDHHHWSISISQPLSNKRQLLMIILFQNKKQSLLKNGIIFFRNSGTHPSLLIYQIFKYFKDIQGIGLFIQPRRGCFRIIEKTKFPTIQL